MIRIFSWDLDDLKFDESHNSSKSMLGRRHVKRQTVKAERRFNELFKEIALAEFIEAQKANKEEELESLHETAELVAIAAANREVAIPAWKKEIEKKEKELLEHLFGIGHPEFYKDLRESVIIKKTPFEDFCGTEEWKAAYESFYEAYIKAAKKEIELRYSVLENL